MRFVLTLALLALCIGAAQFGSVDSATSAQIPTLVPVSGGTGNGDFPQLTATPTRTPTPINIGNFVWRDLDGDGKQDVGEPGIAGVTVQLWNSTKTALYTSTTTNASGNYIVVAPVPGNYRVRVLLPATAFFTLKDQGADDQKDSDINPSGANLGFTDIFTLASNVISTTIYDAGIGFPTTPTPTRTPTPINIGNFVWHDLNGNGVQDAGEPGVPNVTVQLWNEAKTVMLSSTTSLYRGGAGAGQLPGTGRPACWRVVHRQRSRRRRSEG